MAASRAWPTALLAAFIAAGVTWALMRGDVAKDVSDGRRGAHPVRTVGPDASAGTLKPRSAAALKLDPRDNVVSAPAELRKAMVVQEGVRVINELKAANPATFDAAAKRWIETPRVKELIKEWQTLEAGWKEASEEAREARLPDAKAMWEEAMTLLRAEVAKPPPEAGVTR